MDPQYKHPLFGAKIDDLEQMLSNIELDSQSAIDCYNIAMAYAMHYQNLKSELKGVKEESRSLTQIACSQLQSQAMQI